MKNNLKIAWRILLRDKGYSIINVGGFTAGLTAVMLISLWIYDELSFNKSHTGYNRIGQVMVHNGSGTYKTHPIPLAAELRSSFPEDFESVAISTQPQNYTVTFKDKTFKEVGNFAELDFIKMVSPNFLLGNESGFSTPNSILLSETLAKKLFEDSNPINSSIRINSEMDLIVSGVYKDFPKNSDFHQVKFIAPWGLLVSTNEGIKNGLNDWRDNFVHIFTEINEGTTFSNTSAKIKDIKLSHISKEKAESNRPELFLHAMSKWRLYSKFDNRTNVTSEPLQFVWSCAIIGGFILLLACINFMNLNTAQSEKRSKEVGIRKVVGSARWQLISQFFIESLLVAFLALVLSVLLVYVLLPWFNDISGKEMTLPWINPSFWLTAIGFTLFSGLLAGSYPALYLSSFRPSKVLKGTFRSGRSGVIPRKMLVVVQFTVCIALMVSTVVVYRQVQFAKSRPVGYTQEGLIMVGIKPKDLNEKYHILKDELKSSGVVADVAASSSSLTSIGSMNKGFDWTGKSPETESNFATISITPGYGSTVGWKLLDGRDISEELASDSTGFIINAAAVKYMGLVNPVGEMVRWDTDAFQGGEFQILGVVDDMIMQSPFEPTNPTIYFLQGNKQWMFVRVNPRVSTHEAVKKIEAVYKHIVPLTPFDYRLVDEQYQLKFSLEERIGKISSIFAILAILISFLGLFGLASFITEQRTKEIGIRKVLGASISELWSLVSKEFVILIIIACLQAVPIAYYFLNNWLQKYPYHIDISWWFFIIPGAGALLATLLTISFQIIKTALANPIKALRSE